MSTQIPVSVMAAVSDGAIRNCRVERQDAAGSPRGRASGLASSLRLEHLSDGELLASTRSMVGRSNLIQAALLAHLAEVQARGLHRERACSSLYTYCVYELRMSEDMAQRRAAAAKLVRRFPVLLDRVAAGELHLTGLLLLGPHLTDENLEEVLSLAKHRSKREIAKLVRRLDPLPDVPARVEPLGPSGASLANPTWPEAMEALAPVRHLRAGDRPSEWLPADEALTKTPLAALERSTAGRASAALDGAPQSSAVDSAQQSSAVDGAPQSGAVGHVAVADHDAPATVNAPPTAVDAVPAAASVLSAPQRYGVQFTVGEEYVQLLEEARDLIGRATAGRSIEIVHLRAMRLLVQELKKRKCAETAKPRTQPKADARRSGGAQEVATEVPRRRGANSAATEVPRQRGANDAATEVPRQRGANDATEDAHRRGASPQASRYVPAHVRRAVWQRDEHRCAFVDERGQRCRERSGLELHHETAFAKGGPPTEANLSLRCRPHNALAAEADFGAAFMGRKQGRAE